MPPHCRGRDFLVGAGLVLLLDSLMVGTDAAVRGLVTPANSRLCNWSDWDTPAKFEGNKVYVDTVLACVDRRSNAAIIRSGANDPLRAPGAHHACYEEAEAFLCPFYLPRAHTPSRLHEFSYYEPCSTQCLRYRSACARHDLEPCFTDSEKNAMGCARLKRCDCTLGKHGLIGGSDSPCAV